MHACTGSAIPYQHMAQHGGRAPAVRASPWATGYGLPAMSAMELWLLAECHLLWLLAAAMTYRLCRLWDGGFVDHALYDHGGPSLAMRFMMKEGSSTMSMIMEDGASAEVLLR